MQRPIFEQIEDKIRVFTPTMMLKISCTILKDWEWVLWLYYEVFEIYDCMKTYMLKVGKLILGWKIIGFIKMIYKNSVIIVYFYLQTLCTYWKVNCIRPIYRSLFRFTMYFYNNQKYDFWSHAKPFDFKLGL